MVLPTHIVASGGIITNDRDEILLVKNQKMNGMLKIIII